MRKTIVIFSNPFGYGPTGSVIPVLRCLLEQTTCTDIVFAGSGLCLEVILDIPVKIVHLNERDELEIENYLRTLSNAYVIGSQNRFCIKVAKKLNIPCAFIDVLAWFWKEIPADHFLADEIFWIRFPQMESRIPKNMNNIHLVSSIIIETTPVILKENQLIVHIGGAKYPLMNHLPYYYLDLISKGLNGLKKGQPFRKILLAGGVDAVDYLKQKLINRDVTPFLGSNTEFIKELERSAHMFTIAGVSSTFESFSVNVPVSFLPPINLSHIGLIDVLKKEGAYAQGLEWQKYLKTNDNLGNMSEKEALVEIDGYAKVINENEELSKHFVEDFMSMAMSTPSREGQRKIAKYMGNSGGEEITDILIKKWKLQSVVTEK